jgi:hypothetical protein
VLNMSRGIPHLSLQIIIKQVKTLDVNCSRECFAIQRQENSERCEEAGVQPNCLARRRVGKVLLGEKCQSPS